MTLDKKIDHFMTHADGFSNGMCVGYDPLGTLYTLFSGNSTLGGRGVNDHGRKCEDVDYTSVLYSVSKYVGVAGVIFVNYILYGTPQGIALCINVFHGQKST